MNDSNYWFSSSVKQSNIVDIRPTIQQWSQFTSIARFKWKKLTTKELEQTKGNRQKLIILVCGNYTISKNEARNQVDDFFLKNRIPTGFKPIEFCPGH